MPSAGISFLLTSLLPPQLLILTAYNCTIDHKINVKKLNITFDPTDGENLESVKAYCNITGNGRVAILGMDYIDKELIGKKDNYYEIPIIGLSLFSPHFTFYDLFTVSWVFNKPGVATLSLITDPFPPNLQNIITLKPVELES